MVVQELCKATGLPFELLQGEVTNAIKRMDTLRQDVSDTGPYSQIKHPAVKSFWRLCLNSTYKASCVECTAVSV
jgi:hypothetical protein